MTATSVRKPNRKQCRQNKAPAPTADATDVVIPPLSRERQVELCSLAIERAERYAVPLERETRHALDTWRGLSPMPLEHAPQIAQCGAERCNRTDLSRWYAHQCIFRGLMLIACPAQYRSRSTDSTLVVLCLGQLVDSSPVVAAEVRWIRETVAVLIARGLVFAGYA